jgi:hypothetical protein
MEFRDARKKPVLGILSLIIVLGFPLLSMLHKQAEMGFLSIFETGTMLGWFCVGAGLALASLLKEKSQGFYIIFPLAAIALSGVLMNFQLEV